MLIKTLSAEARQKKKGKRVTWMLYRKGEQRDLWVSLRFHPQVTKSLLDYVNGQGMRNLDWFTCAEVRSLWHMELTR